MNLQGVVLMSQQNPIPDTEREIVELEREWLTAIQNQDSSQMDHFLSENYFLAKATVDQTIVVTPRADWLENLKIWMIESIQINDIDVHIYGETAVVLMLLTQKATLRGQDRSGQLMATDIWVKQANRWRVTERHLGNLNHNLT
jgi:ketosteroid isomerase-like protein